MFFPLPFISPPLSPLFPERSNKSRGREREEKRRRQIVSSPLHTTPNARVRSALPSSCKVGVFWGGREKGREFVGRAKEGRGENRSSRCLFLKHFSSLGFVKLGEREREK